MSAAFTTQRLIQFLAAMAASPDERSAVLAATEGAAEALEAEVSAVLVPGEDVVCVGFAAGSVPEPALAAVASGQANTVEVPGAGLCHAVAVRLHASASGHFVAARAGTPFGIEEVNLLRGMARALELALQMLHTLHGERVLRERVERQAAENARLLSSLRERQRLMDQLAHIQRAISSRAPLDEILDRIIAGARELLGDRTVALWMVDADDPEMMLMVASAGISEGVGQRIWRQPVSEGVAGLAIRTGQTHVVDRYQDEPHALPELVRADIKTVMAAPVHENGRVVGALGVGSVTDATFSESDREMLLAFAEHISIAVTDARTVEEMNQAFHDSLTGLASRPLFLDRVGNALANADRERAGVALLYIDLDRFKMVNDTLGHNVGDQLLAEVGVRMRHVMRSGDAAARLGGDEFAVLLTGVSAVDEAATVAQRIISALTAPFAIAGRQVFVAASIGIAMGGDATLDAEELIRHADVAMYQAKSNGRGRYEVFEQSMQARVEERMAIEADLRRAVERDEFALWYQPMIELDSGRVIGAEALLRWHHPERGIVPPLDFIGLAEETGLILRIGQWVLGEACRQAAAWQSLLPDGEPLMVTVNLSARQLDHPELTAEVAHALAASGLPPHLLVLEITETVLLSDTDSTTARLHELRALGVKLAIDDFGTGYSSLSYLRKFPVDILKIDQSFVADLGHGSQESALARTIIELGQTLHLRTVAEGIEDADQLAALRACGCELGQGYHFARPGEPAELEALVRKTGGVILDEATNAAGR